MKTYTPYTYLIGWSQLGLYYYGVRHAKKDKTLYESGCHPDELMVTYFTSCKKVPEIRKAKGNPDIVQIRRTFETAGAALMWEEKVLRRLNVLQKDNWLNANIASHIGMTDEIRTKIKESMLASGVTRDAAFKARVSEVHKGKRITEETKAKIRAKVSGKKHPQFGISRSEKTKAKISMANSGNNQEIFSCPHCHKHGKGSVMFRHHFDRCKANAS